VGPVPLTVGMIASQCGRIAPTVWARTPTVWAVFPHSVGVFPHSVGESRPHCEGFPPHYTSQCDVQCDTLTWSVTLRGLVPPTFLCSKALSALNFYLSSSHHQLLVTTIKLCTCV